MKKLLRDTLATTIALVVVFGGIAVIMGFGFMAFSIIAQFSVWTLLISIPILIFMFAFLIVILNRGLEESEELLYKLDKLLGIK